MKTEYDRIIPSKVWNAALYIRLSKEDDDENGRKDESNSVSSQREILRSFVREKADIAEFDCYVDDGYTGTNFDRPEYMRMMSDIKSGKVDCIIVKDFSRFGRNASAIDNIVLEELKVLGVRFIAVNNGYDSQNSGTSSILTDLLTVNVTNLMNESLSATTSMNVKSTLDSNRKMGRFIGSFASYGYKKDENDHHKLVIDEDAASVVRMIYREFLSGKSILGVTKELNEMGIPSPSAYKAMLGMKVKSHSEFWCERTVKRFLTNEMYIGNMVQGKNGHISYKNQKCKSRPKEQWFVVENTHEPIIDKDSFYKAQELLSKHTYHSPKSGSVDLFSGLIFCGDCGRAMNKKSNVHSYGTYDYYRCKTAKKIKKSACTNHTIRIDKIENAVLVYLRKMVEIAVDIDEILTEIKNSNPHNCPLLHTEATLNKLESEKSKLENFSLELYGDWKNGDLTKDEYQKLKAKYLVGIEDLKGKIEKLKSFKDATESGVIDTNEFVENFKKFKNFDRLNRNIVVNLIERIDVYEGGRIAITFKYKDAFAGIIEYLDTHKNSTQKSA